MMGMWQDSSYFSSFSPPSFFFFLISWFSLIFISLFLLCPKLGTCTLSLFSFHCVSQIFTHLHGHLFLERALSWFPHSTAPPTLFPTMHMRWVLLVSTGGENWEAGQEVVEWAWAASLRDMISSWPCHCFWALGRLQFSLWIQSVETSGPVNVSVRNLPLTYGVWC